jgi:hypothetical protein
LLVFWGGNFALLVCPLLFSSFFLFPQFYFSPSSVIIFPWVETVRLVESRPFLIIC